MLRRPLLTLALACAALPALAQEDRAGLALTLTQGGPALVVDQRRAVLAEGTGTVRLTGVADGAVPGSLQVLSPDGQAQRQTRLGGGPVMPALLAAHVGKTVTLLRDRPDGTTEEQEARVLRAFPDPVLEVDGIILVGLPGRVLFPDLPDDLPLDGAVEAVIAGAKGGATTLTLRYLTGGLSWSADHAVTLSQDRKSLDVVTWATIANGTGMDWPDARLALLAGEVNVVSKAAPPRPDLMRAMAASAPMMEDAAGAGPTREAVGGYHLYRLAAPTTLPRDATTQVALLRASGLAAEVILESRDDASPYHGARRPRDEGHPTQILMLRNPPEGGAGAPLPAGTVRVYGADAAGNTLLLGEDHMDALPVGEEARLTLGEAFDVTVERTTTEHKRLSRDVTETTRRVVLANGAATPATVRVIETLPGDWQVIAESQPHEKTDASRAQWTVTVPAKGTATLTFTVRTTL